MNIPIWAHLANSNKSLQILSRLVLLAAEITLHSLTTAFHILQQIKLKQMLPVFPAME